MSRTIRHVSVFALLAAGSLTLVMGCPLTPDTFQKKCTAATVAVDCDDENFCTKDTCLSGICHNTPDDTLIPNDGMPCTNDACANGTEVHPVKAAGEPCSPGSSLKCDGNGNCPPCVIGSNDCGMALATSCTKPVCTSGTCTDVLDLGKVLPDDVLGDCKALVCDSSGHPTHHSEPMGTPCVGNGKVCDNAGNCVGCLSSSDCTTGNPVCDLLQHKCVSCTDGILNGSETAIDCGGSDCGACLGKTCDPAHACALGATCVMPENICCDMPCNGKCEACSTQNTGKPDGTCAPVSLGKDPKDSCMTQGGCGITADACRCEDGTQNGDETDSDCGGPSCNKGCAQGKKCVVSGDCANGKPCVDGYCCVNACQGSCKSCALAGHLGQCWDVPGGYDDVNTTNLCPVDKVCGPSGAGCLGKATASCNASQNGDDCLSGSCVGSAHTCAQSVSGGLCNNDMDCVTGTTCQNYICKP